MRKFDWSIICVALILGSMTIQQHRKIARFEENLWPFARYVLTCASLQSNFYGAIRAEHSALARQQNLMVMNLLAEEWSEVESMILKVKRDSKYYAEDQLKLAQLSSLAHNIDCIELSDSLPRIE